MLPSEAPQSYIDSLEAQREEMIRYATRKLGPYAMDAEDMVQEAILHAIRYDSTNAFADLKNRCIDYLRHVHSQRRGGGKIVHDQDLLELAQSPEESEDEEVELALARIKDHYSRILKAAYYEDKSYQEIADQEGIPFGTVKSRMHLAKRKMREALHYSQSA